MLLEDRSRCREEKENDASCEPSMSDFQNSKASEQHLRGGGGLEVFGIGGEHQQGQALVSGKVVYFCDADQCYNELNADQCFIANRTRQFNRI